MSDDDEGDAGDESRPTPVSEAQHIKYELRNVRTTLNIMVHQHKALRARLQRLERRPWMSRRVREKE